MKYLIFVQNLKRLLIQIKETGIDPVLIAVPNHRLVHELRTYAFKRLSDSKPGRELGRGTPSRNFTDDLLNKDAFALRVRYGVIKLNEYSVDRMRYFDYLSKAIDQHFGIRNSSSTLASTIDALLVEELAKCFQSWYRPEDIFLVDFARQRQLIVADKSFEQWFVSNLRQYLLQLQLSNRLCSCAVWKLCSRRIAIRLPSFQRMSWTNCSLRQKERCS